MAVFKCKMCAGALEFNQGETVGVCQYCGTKQTLPKLDDEKRIQLYDRANHFRHENEYDKAMGIYEMILADDKEDSEAYWGIVLCKYGIEYVKDPRSQRRIPTVNRAQFTSVLDDKDYLSALEHADSAQREVYEAEAKAIDTIQKGILEISSKEEPFDVFICYKETDSFGGRTQDSVYAQEIYNALNKEGYKVFFARITLENKLGQQYEPFIFAALHSAKVMLVVGTSKENFNAVWVKNEWSRFLALAKEDSSKVIIPCYKDISPYDMPEEFTYLQSQDMSKIGYLQDIVHGVEKLVQKEAVKETVIVNNGTNANTAPLLKRAALFLEDGDWQSADEYCERVLDIDPENGEAYLYKLMCGLKLKVFSDFENNTADFSQNNNYLKLERFGNPDLVSKVKQYISVAKINAAESQINNKYQKAVSAFQSSKHIDDFRNALGLFNELGEYKDSANYIKLCQEKIKDVNSFFVKEAQLKNELLSCENMLATSMEELNTCSFFERTRITELKNLINEKTNELSQLRVEYRKAIDRKAEVLSSMDITDYITKTSRGDVVIMGTLNSKPIKWIVYPNEDNTYYLVSLDSITKASLKTEGANEFNYNQSDIHKWLNKEFKNCFSVKEKNIIKSIRLMDRKDAEGFFTNRFARQLWLVDTGTLYGEPWWITTPGGFFGSAQYVSDEGYFCFGESINTEMAIRPFMVIRLDNTPN